MVLSLIAGLLVGSGYVVLREMGQSTFRTGEDLEAISLSPIMGQIPQIPKNAAKMSLSICARNPLRPQLKRSGTYEPRF